MSRSSAISSGPLLFLVMILLVGGPRHRGALAVILGVIIAASLTWSVSQTRANETWAYLLPLTRAWELALGALLAVASTLASIPRNWIVQAMAAVGLAGIVACSLLLTTAIPYAGAAVALSVMSTGLVIAAGWVKHLGHVMTYARRRASTSGR